MAAISHLSLFFVLALLSSSQIHARSVEMFNKFPSQTNDNLVKDSDETFNTNQQKNFIPENDNSYGLYGHESGQLPPSTTTTTTTNNNNNNYPYNAKYLPKNYNTQAYVTQPEDFSDTTTTTTTTTNNNNNNNYPYNAKYLPKNYNTEAYVTQPEDFSDTTTTVAASAALNGNNYYNGGSQFYNGQLYNSQEKGVKDSDLSGEEFSTTTDNDNKYYDNGVNSYQKAGLGETKFMDNAFTTTTTNNNDNNNKYYNGGSVNGFQRQGLSDTRYLDNGKYYYDVNAEKYSRNPDENSLEFGLNNNANLYQNNFVEGQQQEQFKDEVGLP